jgi:hypothetical protein
MRGRTSINQFVAALASADAQFGGPAAWYEGDEIRWLYADEPSRQYANSNGDWPKDTPKPNKRAMVSGYMAVRKSEEGTHGRYIQFWVTEEPEGYRVTKMKQYDQ